MFLTNEHLRGSIPLTGRTAGTLGGGQFHRPDVAMKGGGRGPEGGNGRGEGSYTSCLLFVGEKAGAGAGS